MPSCKTCNDNRFINSWACPKCNKNYVDKNTINKPADKEQCKKCHDWVDKNTLTRGKCSGCE